MRLNLIKQNGNLIPADQESSVLLNRMDDGHQAQFTALSKKKMKSLDQNRGLFKLHSQFAEQYGITIERAHIRYKGKFLLPLMIRDDEEGRLSQLYEVARTDTEMHKAILELVSTTIATQDQMRESMEEYIRDSCSHGYYLELKRNV